MSDIDGDIMNASMRGAPEAMLAASREAEEVNKAHVERWLKDGMKAYWNDPVFHAKATLARQLLDHYKGWTLQHRAIVVVQMIESITSTGEVRHG